MKYRVQARIDENTPEECLPHIDSLVDVVTVHAEGCRCTFVPVSEHVIWAGSHFRAIAGEPNEREETVFVQRWQNGQWETVRGIDSRSDDYAYTNASEDAQSRQRAFDRPGP